MNELLRCSGLSLGYGGHAVATGVNLSVGPGDGVCVVGENGTGKSTLLRTLLGLQPPLAGEIRFAPDLRPGDVGYLPQQDPAQRDFPATAREVVLSGCQARRGFRPFFRRAERRMAADAMALLVLDEPVTGLDPDAAAELYRVLAALRREGVAVLSVTHDLPDGVADATRVLELDAVPFFGSREEWAARRRAKGGAA